jgi:hypothetical protein
MAAAFAAKVNQSLVLRESESSASTRKRRQALPISPLIRHFGDGDQLAFLKAERQFA